MFIAGSAMSSSSNGKKNEQVLLDLLGGRKKRDLNRPGASDFEVAYRAFRDWIGWTSSPARGSAPKLKRLPEEMKISVLNDVHVPFQDDEALREFIRRESRTTDLLVVAGDLADMWSFSRWSKQRPLATARSEWQAVLSVLRILSENFKRIRLFPGNHEERFVRFLLRVKDDPEFLAFLDAAFPGFSNPLAVLCRGFENMEVVDPLQCGHAEYRFLHQIGDLILGHPEVFSQIPNRAALNFVHYLQGKLLPMGVIQPFRVAAIGHTHQAGKTFVDYGVVAMEMGCMAQVPDYDGNPKLFGARRPQAVGYTVFYQRGGKTDLDRSNFIPLRFGETLF